MGAESISLFGGEAAFNAEAAAQTLAEASLEDAALLLQSPSLPEKLAEAVDHFQAALSKGDMAGARALQQIIAREIRGVSRFADASANRRAAEKALARSTSFTVTNLLASAAFAMQPTGDMAHDVATNPSLSSLWWLLLGLFGPLCEGMKALTDKYLPRDAVDGKKLSAFDANVARGNDQLENSYARMRRLQWEFGISGAVMAIGGIYALAQNMGAPIALLPTFLGMLGTIISQIAISERIRDQRGYYTRKYWEKVDPDLNDLRELAKDNTDSVTTKKVAGWVNMVHVAVEKVAFSRGENDTQIRKLIDAFEGILKTGLRVMDRPNKRVLNYVESMGENSIKPLLDLTLESPNGVLMFEALAKYNSVAKAMAGHVSILEGRAVNWKVEDLSHPNALEAIRWLAQRGNTNILDVVKHWKDGGHQEAIDLWNRFHGAPPAQKPPSEATPTPAPPKNKIEGLEGQSEATAWLEEIRAGLTVDRARIAAGLPSKISLHATFSGPEGVGKRKAGRLYGDLLYETGRFKEGEGNQVLFYDLEKGGTDPKIADRMENQITMGKNVVVLMGTTDEVQAFLKAHPNLAALIKHNVRFSDLGGELLAKILLQMAEEEGLQLTAKAVEKMRHVLRDKRGGSGVAKALLEKAIKHYAKRLEPEVDRPDFDRGRLSVLEAADFSNGYRAMETTALKRLKRMTGLGEVKGSLNRVVAVLEENKRREEEGLPATRPSLHALFVGNPGTGKTTVASIYAQALKELGYLSKGQLVIAKPSEIVGNAVGQAEGLTRAKLDEALGGVFFLDEAHNLLTGESAFGKKALETILTFMEEHRDDVVVIFGGYPEPIEKLLDADPGLRRRFTETITFADYTIDELASILEGMVADKGYTMDPDARRAAVDLLGRQRSGKDFGNAGAVRKLFEAAILRQSARLQEARAAGQTPSREDLQRLTMADFEGRNAPDPQRALKALDSFVGLGRVKQEFRDLMAAVAFNKARGGNPIDWFEPYFLFAGPPGTGKTSVAQVLGRFFHGLGLLPDDKVVVVNALDLMAGVVGQTSGKTRETVERALGGVLFIDEIGGLAKSPGGYSKDAVNQLLTLLEKYRGRLVVVVAGYDKDINAFLRLDDGLSRRFANRFTFESLTAAEAAGLFKMRMQEAKPGLGLDEEAKAALPRLMADLREAPGWASGGDVRTLVTLTIQRQARRWSERHDIDINLVSEEVLREAVNSLIEKKKRDAEEAGAAEEDGGHQHALERAVERAFGAERKTEVDLKTLQALGREAEQAAQNLKLSAEDARVQLQSGDPNSALAQEIAKKTGRDVKKVAAELKKLAEALAKEPKKLGWICMFCGSTNPECPYKDLPEREKFNAWRE